MSLKFCIIMESNSQKTFSTIVLYTTMAAVTSQGNRELNCNEPFGNKIELKICRQVLMLSTQLQNRSVGNLRFDYGNINDNATNQ